MVRLPERIVGVALGLLALELLGCAAPSLPAPPAPAAASMPTAISEAQPRASPQPGPAGTSLSAGTPLEAQARLDLAARLNLAPEEVEVVAVEQAEMPVGSLGCGSTGGVVNPGMIIGQEITLRAKGQEYIYRSDGQRLVPCSPAAFPGGREPILAAGGNAAQFRVQNLAIADLAGRLGISKSAITVRLIEAVQWPDASLGCPQPGMMYAQVITPGYRLVLVAEGQEYIYHASLTNVILCEGSENTRPD